MSAPTCHDCKHVRFSRFLIFVDHSYPKCAKVGRVDPVSGRYESDFCTNARSNNPCGPQGKLFEDRKGAIASHRRSHASHEAPAGLRRPGFDQLSQEGE